MVPDIAAEDMAVADMVPVRTDPPSAAGMVAGVVLLPQGVVGVVPLPVVAGVVLPLPGAAGVVLLPAMVLHVTLLQRLHS